MKFLVVQAYWYFDIVTGEFRYRIESPGNALADHPDYHVINIHVFHPLFTELVLNADLLILHLMPDAEIEQIVALRKRLGKATLFEIADNFLCVGPWVGKDDAHRSPYIRQQLLHYAGICDGLQFSSEEVATTFGHLNDKHVVFENQADHFNEEKTDGSPVVIGWGGSKGHEEDLARIAPVVIDLCKRRQDVVFSYMGYTPIYDRLFAGKIPKAQTRIRPAGPIEDYFAFLKTLHIGLAPLADTEFNRCRSDIKFVEYAAHRIAPVLADAAPYRVHARHGENAFLFQNNEQLDAILEELVDNPEQRNTVAQNAYRFATIRRSAMNHVGKRNNFYQRFLRHDPFTADFPELPECAGLMAHLRVAVDHLTAKNYTESLKLLEKVLAIHPNYAAAHVWHMRCLLEKGDCQKALETYGSYTPPAIYSDQYYEAMAVAAKELHIEGWQNIVLRIMDPVLRLELNPATEPDPLKRLRTILAHNPYHYKSLVDLVAILAKGEERTALLDRLCFMEPESETFAKMRNEA